MPAMHYRLRWPDGSEARCYSPSLVIRDFLAVGQSYPLADFLERLRRATRIASDRVAARFGLACLQAWDQLAEIEAQAARFTEQDGAAVAVIAFEE